MQMGAAMSVRSIAPAADALSATSGVGPYATRSGCEHGASETKEMCISPGTPVTEMCTCSTPDAAGGAAHAGGAHCDSAEAPSGEQSPAGHGFIFS